MRKLLKLVAILVFTAIGLPSYADVDTIYSIDIANSDLSCCSGPYATVDVHWIDNTHATVTFDSVANGGYIYLMGAEKAVDINVNAFTWAISGITGTNSVSAGFTPGPFTDTGSGPGSVDGFGNFNQTIESFDGFTNTSTEITFNLQDISSTWSGSEKVLTPNGDGFIVAIHGFACAQPGCSSTGSAFATGFASTTAPISAVPEPEIYAMMGVGLMLMGFVARRRQGQAAAA